MGVTTIEICIRIVPTRSLHSCSVDAQAIRRLLLPRDPSCEICFHCEFPEPSKLHQHRLTVMSEPLETIDTSSNEPLPASTLDDVGECQSPLTSNTPSNDTRSAAEGGDTTDRDDFLSWDPWGDDSERYPEGFWNHMNLLDAALTARNNEHSSEIPTESQSITRADSPEAATALSGHGEGDDTTECKEETAKKISGEQKDTETEKKTGEEKEEEVPAESQKECTICLESMATDRYPDLPHTAESEHSSDVCHACWEQHLESEVSSKVFEGVSCPQCSQRLLEVDVRKLANSSTYAR